MAKDKYICKIVIMAMTVLCLCSCQKYPTWFTKGEAVKFSVGTNATLTKAVYSGEGTATTERIDWQEGDLLRIYCEQVSEPAGKFADYRVKSVDTPESGSAVSSAHIEIFSEVTGGVGLRWGTGGHTFYGVYPSPEEEGSLTVNIGKYDDGGTKGSVSKSIEGPIVTAKLPAKQALDEDLGIIVSTDDATLQIAAPDLKNMLMTAKSAEYIPETGIPEGTVFLSFTPLTTAVQFTITNQTKSTLTLSSVSLISAENALNGPFSVNIDNSSVPESIDLDGDGSKTGVHDIIYSRQYPECTYTGSVSSATKAVKIRFESPVTLTYDADPAKSGKLTFTFFLQPCRDFDDLTFKLVKSDGSWMSTKLSYANGSGVLFPRFKKSMVTGILVPEGAQWTVKYGPTVEPWNQSSSDIDPMPEVNEGTTLVTSWDPENGGNLVFD